MQLSWEKWLAEARLLVCSCWGFTLQMLGGSEVLAVFVLSEEVVYVPAPESDVVGVTEATGIGGIDALEKEL